MTSETDNGSAETKTAEKPRVTATMATQALKSGAVNVLDQTALTLPGQPPVVAPDKTHWLVQPEMIRKIWIGSIAVLALTVLAQLTFHMHGYFHLEESFGFGAWYGFVACVILVVGSKLLGFILKRPDTYYDD